MSSSVDVIIVGAGSAGLSAAKELRRLGLTTAVIEGSHRIGGRAYSEEIAPGVWFDLGCSYLHHGRQNPFGPIADELGVALNRGRDDLFNDTLIRPYNNSETLAGERLDAYWAFADACEAALRDSVARGEDRAIVDFVDLESPFAVPYCLGMAALNTVDVDQMSAADYADFGSGEYAGGSDIPVPGGYGNLVARWGADVEVTLNARAERIDWSGSGVRVETPKGTLAGRAVLVTVSTGILASNAIRFDPGLPVWKVDAYRALPTGTENKIGVHFDRDVFGPDGLGFYMTWNDDGEGAGFEASVNANDTAIVFTGGRHAVWLEKQGQQAGHDFAVGRIADVFGNDIRKHVTRSIVTAWTTEPWTLGSYSAARPGQAHQRRELARPVGDRVFFAGEATAPQGAQATCHGAYLSGRRAAAEIAEVLSD
ncbi:MAG: NAD(P)/FAD-dependent oxidoreductase [Rhodospirillales bacterium]